MSDEAALLTAIAAHPDEDTPRLMYADWLQEHGQPVRAEFVRVQIDIARKDHLPRAILNRYVDLFKRNQELIDDHRAELLGPLAALPADARVEFRRGFVTAVTLDAEFFPAYADPLAALVPRPELALEGTAAQLDALAAVSHLLTRVTALHMQNRRHAPTALTPTELWEQFVEGGWWDSLRVLNLERCQIGDEGMDGLTCSTHLGLVTDLDLSQNALTDHGLNAFLDCGLPGQLKRLILGGNDITDAGAVALVAGWPTGAADRLEHLNLRFTNIGPVGQAALLRRFGRRLDLF